MGSSNRKKKLKAKDFKKQKLKVGKTQIKQANQTNTDFKAKKIVISGATKHLAAGKEVKVEYLKKFSLLKNSTANLTSRKEIIAELLDNVQKCKTQNLPLDELIKVIRILFIDQSKKIRQDAYDILCKLVENHTNLVILNHDSLMLFLFSAMTHLKPTIRQDSVRILMTLLNGNDRLKNLTINNYWVRIWKNIMILMNWKKENKSYVDQNDFKDFNGLRVEQLTMILKVIQLGCSKDEINLNDETNVQIHTLLDSYMLRPNMGMLYRNLKLFGNFAIKSSSANKEKNGEFEFDDAMVCEDLADRLRIFVDGFYELVETGLIDYIKTEDSKLVSASKAVINTLQDVKRVHSEICVD
ncbi:Ipi1 protein [Martiniozyma asiatica (nom. inval.)]|nr:Ipi1 protein [Martiniozyma asiatica]